MKRAEAKEYLTKLVSVAGLVASMTKTTKDDSLVAFVKSLIDNGQIDLLFDLIGLTD